MLPWLANQTVTRVRGAASTDDYNNAGVNWSSPQRHPIAGCSVQPVEGDEFNEGRDAVTTRWRLFMPPDADVKSYDRISWRGDDYDIDGSVGVWEDPTGGDLGHKTALLKRVEG